MKKIIALFALCLCSCSYQTKSPEWKQEIQRTWEQIEICEALPPVWSDKYQTVYSASYDSNVEDQELDSLQCPIPMKDRVRNYTGIQCVYSSLEMIGRWAEEPKLMDPPLTSRSECKGFSNPRTAGSILNKLQVKHINVYNDRKRAIEVIKTAMEEHRGALFGVPGHAMVLVHFDDTKENIVKYVDNSDRQLKVQTMSMKNFENVWDGWVMVVYADNDIIDSKVSNLANKIPIIDRNGQQGTYEKNYIPIPMK